jgi:glucose/arabinose dehydrogenase
MMNKKSRFFLILSAALFFNGISFAGDTTVTRISRPGQSALVLPDGFKASIFYDSMSGRLGHARHLTVSANGDVYVKLEKLKDGKGIFMLSDENKDGVSDKAVGFGNYIGTGIAIKNEYLYASSDDAVYRYKMVNGVSDMGNPETIVKGLWNKKQHASKSITLDNAGNIYVNIGAPANVCQEEDRKKGSPGRMPCPLLDSAGGIWQFRADKQNQVYGDGVRYATGLRNVVGLDWNNESNDLYAMQHGRDMLFQFYPELFNQQEGAVNPAEEMFRLPKGADAGWPYCYFDNGKQKKLLNPEYGGDRNKPGVCPDKTQSIMQFPGHLAPNALMFYTGSMFPEKYKNGAFIAFHGSWNRAPEPQEGYFVVFIPFKNGMPSGNWEIFADGFAGAGKAQGKADHRPAGLAQGPDGALYVSDDQKGMIWKITYSGQ